MGERGRRAIANRDRGKGKRFSHSKGIGKKRGEEERERERVGMLNGTGRGGVGGTAFALGFRILDSFTHASKVVLNYTTPPLQSRFQAAG